MNHHEAMQEVREGKLRPVYLIYGGEPFLEAELTQAIRDKSVQPETADFNYHVIDSAPDQIKQALAVAQTEPFFAPRRLVVVKGCTVFAPAKKKQQEESDPSAEEKSGDTDETLIAYLKSPAPSTVLLFLAGETVDSRKRVTKAIIATGGAVECKELKEQDAVMWAQNRATSYGKKLGDQAARLLVEKVGADLRFIDSELQKLSLYVGDNKAIQVTDVDVAVGGIAETEMFKLTEAVMLKQRTLALRLLAKVMRQVDHPLQVLAALTNRFRQILTVKSLLERGVSQREGPGIAKMHPFAYQKIAEHVRYYPRPEIVRALSKLLEADLAMKSGYDAELTLQTLVVELMP